MRKKKNGARRMSEATAKNKGGRKMARRTRKWIDAYKKDTLVEVPVATLVKAKADFNPRIRESMQMKPLEASISEHGLYHFMPILVGCDGRVGDGHRRIAAAAKLRSLKHPGLDTLPTVICSNQTSVELFSRINSTQRRLNTKEMLLAVHKGLPLDAVPNDGAKRNIAFLIQHKLLDLAVDVNSSPTVVHHAHEVFRALRSEFVEDLPKKITPQSITKWMLRNKKSQQAARNWVAVPERANCQRVVDAITGNKGLPQPYRDK
jgi:hypothetical protein